MNKKHIIWASIIILWIVIWSFSYNYFSNYHSEKNIDIPLSYTVKILVKKENPLYRDTDSRFFDFPEKQIESSWEIGSWFFISKDWIIITNKHVIDNASSIEIMLQDKTILPAITAFKDLDNDIALLQVKNIEVDSLPTFYKTELSDTEIWQDITIIGNTVSENFLTSNGNIISVNNEIKLENNTFINLIETNIQVEKWYSGGPVINNNWKIIGITTLSWNYWNSNWYAIELNKEIINKYLSELK